MVQIGYLAAESALKVSSKNSPEGGQPQSSSNDSQNMDNPTKKDDSNQLLAYDSTQVTTYERLNRKTERI